VTDPGARVVRHLARAAQELALAFALAVQTFGGRSRALADLHAALRDEERRWRARARDDEAAARVARIFAALADVFEPPAPPAPRRQTRFDPPPPRWDTRAPWRS